MCVGDLGLEVVCSRRPSSFAFPWILGKILRGEGKPPSTYRVLGASSHAQLPLWLCRQRMCYGMVSPAGSRRAVAVAGVISMSTLSANLKLSYMTEVDVINVIISWLGEKACRKVHFRLQLTNPTNKPTTNDWIT